MALWRLLLLLLLHTTTTDYYNWYYPGKDGVVTTTTAATTTHHHYRLLQLILPRWGWRCDDYYCCYYYTPLLQTTTADITKVRMALWRLLLPLLIHTTTTDYYSWYYPGEDSVVAGHDNGQVKERSAANEPNATHERICFLRHLAQQISRVQTKADSGDTSRTCDHAKYQTHAAHI